MKFLITSVALGLLNMGVSAAEQQTNQFNLRRNLQMQEPCMLVQRHTMYRAPNVHDQEWDCEIQGSESGAAHIVSISGINLQGMADEQQHDIVSGESTMYVQGAEIRDGQMHLPPDPKPVFGRVEPNRRRLDDTNDPMSGNRTVLIIRVVATDASTTRKPAAVTNHVLGTYGDPVNFATQYEACSNGKLRFIPTPDRRFRQGVFTVPILESVSGNTHANIRNAVTTQLRSLVGDLGPQFDHVMYCLPPGTNSNWVAYSYVNHWLSVFNDEWCNYVGPQTHAIGINLGLGLSGMGSNEYGDQSGTMGYSVIRSSNYPRRCFNGAKTWQLGWFADRHTTVNGTIQSWRGDTVGAVDYPISQGKSVVIKLTGDDVYDYFINFNHNAGANSDTRYRPNHVLVTAVERGVRNANSNLLAALYSAPDSASSFTIENFGDTLQDVTITVHNVVLDETPAYADVSITGAMTPAPTPAPTEPQSPSDGEFRVTCVCRPKDE